MTVYMNTKDMQGIITRMRKTVEGKGYDVSHSTFQINAEGEYRCFGVYLHYKDEKDEYVYLGQNGQTLDEMQRAVADMWAQIDAIPSRTEANWKLRINQLEEFREELFSEGKDDLVALIDRIFEPMQTNLLTHDE
jgi:hypothetical protein